MLLLKKTHQLITRRLGIDVYLAYMSMNGCSENKSLPLACCAAEAASLATTTVLVAEYASNNLATLAFQTVYSGSFSSFTRLTLQ